MFSTKDSVELPTSILIKFAEITYRIFTSYDKLFCFSCKIAGHIAIGCPNNVPQDTATLIVLENPQEEQRPSNAGSAKSPHSPASLAKDSLSALNILVSGTSVFPGTMDTSDAANTVPRSLNKHSADSLSCSLVEDTSSPPFQCLNAS